MIKKDFLKNYLPHRFQIYSNYTTHGVFLLNFFFLLCIKSAGEGVKKGENLLLNRHLKPS